MTTLEAARQKRVAAQHAKGKLTARERLDVLLDEGSFAEFGANVKHRCNDFGMDKNRPAGDSVITGHGQINGRAVLVYSQDFTVFGGSLSEVHGGKIARLLDMALSTRTPVIGLNDSGGARIQEGVLSLAGYGEVFMRHVAASGVVPQISVIMGPCAGGAVYAPALTDFIFMVRDTASMFVTGPDVVKTVTGESIDIENLGGASVHTQKSSVASNAYNDDLETLMQVRRLVDYLPNAQPCPTRDPWNRSEPSLNTLIPQRAEHPYDMHELIEKIVDDGDYFEIAPDFARNILTAFAHMDGHVVGFVANMPAVNAGCLDSDASRKAARFVRFCDAFDIPLITLVDVPGFLPGSAQEHGGLIVHGAKLLFAYAEATVPKISVVTRKAYGGAYDVMSSKHIGGDVNLAWPTAQIAVMGARGAAEILYRDALHNAQLLEEKIRAYENRFSTPDTAAEHGFIDAIIEPAHTRLHVINALRLLRHKQVANVPRKHNTMPL